MAVDRNYPIGQKICAWCGDKIDVYSNAQKYCSRDDSPECDDERHFEKLLKQGKHPLQKELKLTQSGEIL